MIEILCIETRKLIIVDTRKGLAVYEQDGVKRIIHVNLDRDGMPVLTAKDIARLDLLFEQASRRLPPIAEIPDSPYARPPQVIVFGPTGITGPSEGER